MRRLRVIDFGTEVQGVRLEGDRRNPEPESFRVSFPGGDVDVVRTTDGQYWVHIRVNDAEDVKHQEDHAATVEGCLVDARLNVRGKATRETDVGDFANPGLYHLTVRVAVVHRAAMAEPVPPQASLSFEAAP